MARVKRGVTAKARHKKVLGKAKGYYGARSKLYKTAKQAVIKAGQYAYRDRRQRKRQFRALWITRITAACKMRGTRYSLFMNGMKHSNVLLNRKMLSQIAIEDPKLFDQLVEMGIQAAKATPKKAAPAVG